MIGQDFSKVLDFGKDLKNYHTVMDPVDDYYYMAGTLFDDLAGRQIASLYKGSGSANALKAPIDISAVSSGMYLVQISVNGTFLNPVKLVVK